ncbi:MAG: HD-GYP domain-containing protein [Gallionella sp.]|nr:HD-GYP domain-containing protein [Gallionella sp.]
MQKRISVEQLRLGMYIHELGCSWMDHPFWRKSFLLEEPHDLKTIASTRTQWVSIDTSKGLDVAVEANSASTVGCQPAAGSDCAGCWGIKQTDNFAQASQAIPQRVSTAQEAARAEMICEKSKLAVASMFQETRMGQALNADDALPIVEEISSSVLRNPGALISLARLKGKDDYTYMHSVAVCTLMVSLARQLGLDAGQIRQAGLAGLLHDVGKMMIPPEILNKPGKLTDAEFDTVKNHPAEGHKLLLGGIGITDMSLDVCLHHHEKVDGSGYPEKLAGDEISLYAKMGAVCDVYDAITSNRPYKNGWEPADSIRKMAEWSRGHFDQRIFQAFVRRVGIYPTGSLVRLASGRLAVVIEQSEKSLLAPRVKVFFSIKSNCRIVTEITDLAHPACRDKIESFEDPLKWHIHDLRELWSGLPG